jgi:regulatory protein
VTSVTRLRPGRVHGGSTGRLSETEGTQRKSLGGTGPSGREAEVKRKVLRLLAVRERSRKELLDRLGQGAAEVVDKLSKAGLQDDRRFAEEWTRSGVARLHGPLRVRRELTEKGVAGGIVDSVLAEAYGGERERELASRAAGKHRSSLAAKDPQRRARTMYAYLLRRGFNPALAGDLAREEMHT